MPISMAGFVLGNTLSDNGGVTRGVCVVDENGNLTGVNETKNIVKTAEGAGVEKEDGTVDPIDKNSLVSMNMWGLQPEFIDLLEKGFVEFLSAQKEGDVKGEYLLPIYIDELLHAGKAEVKVLPTDAEWFGVTYHGRQSFRNRSIPQTDCGRRIQREAVRLITIFCYLSE
mgnify:CR=1 FL=1